MRKTQNINLNLYDQSDTFNITGSQNSLNSNFEIIDEEINALNNTNSIDEVKNDVASLKEDLVKQSFCYQDVSSQGIFIAGRRNTPTS